MLRSSFLLPRNDDPPKNIKRRWGRLRRPHLLFKKHAPSLRAQRSNLLPSLALSKSWRHCERSVATSILPWLYPNAGVIASAAKQPQFYPGSIQMLASLRAQRSNLLPSLALSKCWRHCVRSEATSSPRWTSPNA
ncbi:MAG: hypothetical protein PHU33_13220 [Bacteroidales bacterium]|nr:hypothetical protein [Bacteroidales bacterium]